MFKSVQKVLRVEHNARVGVGLFVAGAIAVTIWVTIDSLLLSAVAFVLVFWGFYIWNVVAYHLPDAGSPAFGLILGSRERKKDASPMDHPGQEEAKADGRANVPDQKRGEG